MDKCSKHVLNRMYEKAAIEFAESFKPWRSYLTIAVWNKKFDWSMYEEVSYGK